MGIKYKIDSLDGEAGRLHVTGWAVSEEKRPITWTLSARRGEPVQSAKYYTVKRPDVSRKFFSSPDYPDCGFEIEANLEAGRKILLNLSDGVDTISVVLTPQGVMNRLKRYRRSIREYRDQRPYQRWFQKQQAGKKELEAQSRESEGPLISVVVPVYRTPLAFLKAMVKSIQNQSYGNWQLCISNSGARDGEVEAYLRRLTEQDSRILVTEQAGQLGISDNTNQAIALAQGAYIGFMDHDDLLEPDALYHVAKAIKEHPDAIAFYTDEDKVSVEGRFFFAPHFKPAFDRHLLLTNNYISHFFVVNRNKVPEDELRLRPLLDGSQDYDLVLRLIGKAAFDQVIHIPRVLYHWRSHPGSTAAAREAKSYTAEAGLKALQSFCKEEPDWEPERTEQEGYYRVRMYEPEEIPSVSVILKNVRALKDMPGLERKIQPFGNGKMELLIETAVGLNRKPRGEWLFFADAGWIDTLAESFRRMSAVMKCEGVGGVTGKILDERQMIRSIGVHLEGKGENRMAVSSFDGFFEEGISYGNLTKLRHQVFGAMPILLLIRRDLFEKAGSPVCGRLTPEQTLLAGARIGKAALDAGCSIVYEPEVAGEVAAWPYPTRVSGAELEAEDVFLPEQIRQQKDGDWKVEMED